MRFARLLIIMVMMAAVGIPFSYAARINIPAELSTRRIRLFPQGAPAAEEGRMYYDSAQNQFYYHDGSGWKVLGGAADNRAGSVIVAAYNSLGSEMPGGGACTPSNGSGCTNPRADIVCDGISDGATINSAIVSLGSSGGTIYLLEGTYDNNGVVFTARSNINLIGQGASTVLKQKAGTSNGITVTNGDSISVSDLVLDGNSLNPNAITLEGLVTTLTRNCSFDNIKIINSGSVIMRNAKGNSLTDIDIDNGSIFMDSASENLVAHNSIVSGKGISLIKFSGTNNADRNMIMNNRIKDTSVGINIGSDPLHASSGGAHHNTVSYNYLEATNAPGQIRVAGSSYNRIGCNIVNEPVAGSGIYIDPYDALLSSWVPSGNLVTGNMISKCPYWGLYIKGADSSGENGNDSVIANNLLFNNAAIFGASSPDIAGWHLAGEICNYRSNRNLLTGNFLFNFQFQEGSTFGYAHNALRFDTRGSSGNYYAGNSIWWPMRDRVIMQLNDDTTTSAFQAEALTLEPAKTGEYSPLGWPETVLTPLRPASYIPLDFFPPVHPLLDTKITAIAPGRATGDLLILEGGANTNIFTVSLRNYSSANTLLHGSQGVDQYVTIPKRGILVLIWNGSRWVELSYWQNIDS